MVNYKINTTVKSLLQNPQFILWCYTPNEENELFWNTWMDKHPESKQDITVAKSILLSLKINNIPLSVEDSNQLYSRIQASYLRRQKKKKTRQIIYTIAAACIACFLVSGFWIYIEKESESNLLPLVTPIAGAYITGTETEIELELGGEDKLIVNNKATIKISNEGSIDINQDQIIDTAVKPQKPDSIGITNTSINVLKVPRGRHTVIHLADGSKVWVNSQTVLQFPTVFDKEHRTIYVDGEIYLEVAKDTSRPFYVQTSQMNVRVLGTSFNITAYSEDSNQSVVLKEGLVEVKTPSGSTQTMHPNDRLVYEDNRIEVSKVKPYNYISWTDGVFLFDKEPIKNITQRLSRYYKVNIVCSSEVKTTNAPGNWYCLMIYRKFYTR